MTAEDLTELVKKGPTDQLVDALAVLTEAERKKLSKTAVALRKELIPNPRETFGQRSDKMFRVRLALLGLAAWGEVQRLRVFHVLTFHIKEKERDQLFQVIHDRRPAWLPQWVDRELHDNDRLSDWQFVRRLIKAKLCPKPDDEHYTQAMLRSFYSADAKQSLKERLLDDPELLTDEVWRIFEKSGVVVHASDITYEPAGHQTWSWARALAELAGEGKLDRRRLLSGSLAALSRKRDPATTGWFYKFHELLEPKPEERQSLQPDYLQLLGHPVSTVVQLALDGLAVVEKANTLDASAFVDAVGPVFYLQPKGQPIAAIKLLGRVAAAEPKLAPRLAEVLIAGLSHPVAQVQEAIVKLLGQLDPSATEAIAALLPAQIDHLAASVQEKARKLLPADATPSSPVVSSSDSNDAETSYGTAAELSDLIAEARQVPARWREAAGIDSLLDAIAGNGDLPAVHVDPMSVPRLHAEDREQPIQTLDELIERLTIAVEGLDDAVEYELLIDGMSRLCDQRPADFAARIAPLLKRCELPKHAWFTPMLTSGLRMGIIIMIHLWCKHEVRRKQDNRDALTGFLDDRLSQVVERFRTDQAAPLLACPTHRRGWIDPMELAGRMRWYHEHAVQPSNHDFIQALLRLAPDGRAEALASSADLKGPLASAFRYALGGVLDDRTLQSGVLIAAGRARAPFAVLEDLRFIGDGAGPGVLQPARYSWKVNSSSSGTGKYWARLHVFVEPQLSARDKIRDMPTALLHVSPRNVPFSEMAQLLVAWALNEQSPEMTGLAVDALVELIADGRCVGAEMGQVLGRMIPHKITKLNRLGRHLGTVARSSLLHAHVCAQIVQRACLPLTEVPKDGHYLLAPLLEWLSSPEQGVIDALRPLLEKATTGKTGTLSRKLLELPGTTHKSNCVFAVALQGRWLFPGFVRTNDCSTSQAWTN